MKQTHNYITIAIIIIVLLCVWMLSLWKFNEPFWGHHENPPTFMSAAVRTYNQFGADAVNFLVVDTLGPTTPEDGHYYLHHPPLIIWLIALATPFFGVDSATLAPHESTVRMVSIIPTMLSLSLMYVIIRRITKSSHIALVGFVLYALSPLVLFFGRAPHYDLMLMPLVYAFIAVFINWIRAYTPQRSLILGALAVVMMWIDWPGVFYLTALGFYTLIFGSFRHRRDIVIIGIITLTATIGVLIFYEVARPGTFSELLDIFSLRTSTQATNFDSEAFTMIEFLVRHLGFMLTSVGVAVTVLGSIGLFFLKNHVSRHDMFMIWTLLITPHIFMLIVPNSFYFHDWYRIHFVIGLIVPTSTVIYYGWLREPVHTAERYIKPILFATVSMSIVAGLGWVYSLHQVGVNNTFGPALAADLPRYTSEADDIASNVSDTERFDNIEFYAYRNVRWGVLPETVEAFYETEERVDLYYVWCLEPQETESFEGYLTDFAYEQVADNCRLIHLEK